jgi:hypothetical protein
MDIDLEAYEGGESSSAYLQNTRVWTADHNLDGGPIQIISNSVPLHTHFTPFSLDGGMRTDG